MTSMLRPRLLVLSQRVDEDHAILGFFVGWIEALSRAAGSVEVVAQAVGRHPFGDRLRITSLGKEKGASKLSQGLALQQLLHARLPEVDAVLCHMNPEYVALCYPLSRLKGKPITLWYTHGAASVNLRLALLLADKVVTAAERDFPIDNPRVVELGHGIDTVLFSPCPIPSSGKRTVLSVGRLSPVKDHLTVLKGFADLLAQGGHDHLSLRIVGGPPMAEHLATVSELEITIRQLDLESRVTLVGSLPYRSVVSELSAGHVLVSASRTGSLDKVVLEAMACGRPVLTSNEAFRSELGQQAGDLMFAPGNAAQLSEKLGHLMARSDAELEALGASLASHVQERHDLESFAGRLVAALSR